MSPTYIINYHVTLVLNQLSKAANKPFLSGLTCPHCECHLVNSHYQCITSALVNECILLNVAV
jgi:hypothetical protein